MRCQRCHGLMVPEFVHGFAAKWTVPSIGAWRCGQCRPHPHRVINGHRASPEISKTTSPNPRHLGQLRQRSEALLRTLDRLSTELQSQSDALRSLAERCKVTRDGTMSPTNTVPASIWHLLVRLFGSKTLFR